MKNIFRRNMLIFSIASIIFLIHNVFHHSSKYGKSLTIHTYHDDRTALSNTSSPLREETILSTRESNVNIDSHEGTNGTDHTPYHDDRTALSNTSSPLREETITSTRESNVNIDSHEGTNGTDHTPNENETIAVKQQFFNFSSDLKDCNDISLPSDLFIPIFVLSRDRLGALKASVESYQQTFASPYEIIILDHNTTYPPMLEYYRKMQDEKQFTVHSLQSEAFPKALREAGFFIKQYLKAHPHADYYVFTDSDIAFYHAQPDALLFYAANLAACPMIKVVGPALKISDIPDTYDKTKYFGDQKKFYTDVPSVAIWKGIGYHVALQPIDTTFAMRRRDTSFCRIISKAHTLRAYAPYIASHTDWYLNSTNLPEDKVWYKDHLGVNRDVNHH